MLRLLSKDPLMPLVRRHCDSPSAHLCVVDLGHEVGHLELHSAGYMSSKNTAVGNATALTFHEMVAAELIVVRSVTL